VIIRNAKRCDSIDAQRQILLTDEIKVTFGQRTKIKLKVSEVNKQQCVESSIESGKRTKKVNGIKKLEEFEQEFVGQRFKFHIFP
jgi:hypothetical protein